MKEQILREIPEKREQCVKHFELTEKGMAAAIYPAPVHYEEDGVWQEIDNRLEEVTEDGKPVYQNKASSVKVSFAEDAGEDGLVSLEKNGNKVTWGLMVEDVPETQRMRVRKKNSKFRVLEESEYWKPEASPNEVPKDQNPGNQESETPGMGEGDSSEDDMEIIGGNTGSEKEPAEEEPMEETSKEESDEATSIPDDKDVQKMMSVPNLVSEGVYEDILEGVDLHYVLQGERIKENIRLQTKEAAEQKLSFTISHPGMILVEEEDGSLGLYPEDALEERAFQLVKPYMYDSAGASSQNVYLKVEMQGEKEVISVQADAEWLQAEDRVYPVIIDPMTETSKTRGNIEDTYIFNNPNSAEDPSQVYAYGALVVGQSDIHGSARALLRFKNLPSIGKGSIIYAATMYLWQWDYSSYGIAKIPLLAHEIKNSWTEKSARWSNQPKYDGNVLDYKMIGNVKNGNTITITPIGFDVTRLVRQWYNTGNNYGIVIRSRYEADSNLANRACGKFYASDSPSISSDQYPSGVFYYRNVNGLEDYQSYHEQSAGRAGDGHTNDYTGNIVWIHPDLESAGGPMRSFVKHVYNSSEAGTESRFGYGWRLSCQEKLASSGNSNYPYVYTDEDGTKHYFYKDTSDGNKLKDEDGLGLTITKTSGTTYDENFVMKTKDDVEYTFAKDGFLRTIKDPDGNTVVYKYRPNSKANYLLYITDSTGEKMTVNYKDDATLSRMTSIEDSQGRLIKYDYDDKGNLTTITYPDGQETKFAYDSSHKLTDVTGPDGYQVHYDYVMDFKVPRVGRIAEKGKNGEKGQELKISYENGNTTIFEEPGLDGDIENKTDNKTSIWHFDNMGRPSDIVDSDGFANNYTYYTSGMKNHKLSKEGAMQKSVYGLLENHLFTSTKNWYTANISEENPTKGTITQAGGYSGMKSAKLEVTAESTANNICQDVTLEAGTYTFSAYLKTESVKETESGESQRGAGLAVIRGDKTRIYSDRLLTGDTDPKIDSGWERLSVGFTLTEKETVTACTVFEGMTGNLYISGAQLEQGKVANKLNLVQNASFEKCTGNVPDHWSYNGGVTGDKSKVTTDKGRCGCIKGNMDKALNCAQSTGMTGSEGEVYQLSGWVKGFGIPGKQYSLSAEVIYTDKTSKWYHFKANPNIKDWQFINGTFRTDDGDDTTNKKYKDIKVYVKYDNQSNQVLFKGIQLLKDDGETYQYDNNGNLVSSIAAADKSYFTYSKKDLLTRMGSVDGTAFDYGYDDKKHLVRAAGAEGVRYSFDYDPKGQPVGMRIEGGKTLGSVTTGRIYYVREKYSGNYLDVKGNKSDDGTIIQLYPFNGGKGQCWKVVDCENGYVRLVPQNAPGSSLDLAKISTSENAKIQLHTSNKTDAQMWKLNPKKDGSYQISNKGTGNKKGLSNETKSVANSQPVHNCTLSDSVAYQDWYFEPTDEGKLSDAPEAGKVYCIRGRQSGKYVDIHGIKTAEGSPSIQGHYHGGPNQQFRLHKAEGVYYQLEALHAPGMVLAKHGKDSEGYALLCIEKRKENATNQMFRFEEIEAGKGTGYAIVCKDGTSFDVKNYSRLHGAEIILTTHKATKQLNKWWLLEECSDRMQASMAYTSDGRHIASVTDVKGQTTKYEYDEQNRLLTRTVDAKGNATNYKYDVVTDKLTEVTQTVDGKEAKVTYSYEHDRMKTMEHAGTVYTYGYDAYGNQESVSVGDVELAHVTYKANNGVEDTYRYATGEVIRNVYDAEERLKSQYLVNPDGTEEKLYEDICDSYGKTVLHKDLQDQTDSWYQYDTIGRVLGVDRSNGMRLRNQYDDKNRVKGSVQKINGQTLETGYIYGEAKNLEKPSLIYGVSFDGTRRVSYAYDELARCRKSVLNLGEEHAYETEYEYEAGAEEGTTTPLIRKVRSGGVEVEYIYDEVGNIRTITESSGQKITYHYDELAQLVREDRKEENQSICYTYDVGGNMTMSRVYAYVEPDQEIGEDLVPEKEVVYGYENNNWKDQLTTYDGQTITYDAMGNPLSYKRMDLTWKKGRMLRKIQKEDQDIQYVYNSDGVRTGKRVDGKQTTYYLNGTKVLGLQTEEELLQFAYDDKGQLLLMKVNGKNYYYLHNAQGDVVGLLDGAGSQVVTYKYDSWGRILSVEDKTEEGIGQKNPFRYREYFYDEETGFYYVNSRYYDPEVKRFINADDLFTLQITPDKVIGKNLYVYCNNNPVVLLDKEGMCPALVPVVWAIGGMVISVATSALAAKVTGQEFTKEDAIVMIGSGLIGGFVGAFAGPLAGAYITGEMTMLGGIIQGKEAKEALIDGAVAGGLSYSGKNAYGTLTGYVKANMPESMGIIQKAVTVTVFETGDNLAVSSVQAGAKNYVKNRRYYSGRRTARKTSKRVKKTYSIRKKTRKNRMKLRRWKWF